MLEVKFVCEVCNRKEDVQQGEMSRSDGAIFSMLGERKNLDIIMCCYCKEKIIECIETLKNNIIV